MKKIAKIFVVILAISVIAMIGIFTVSCKVTPGPVTTDATTQTDTTYAHSNETTTKNVETKDTTKVEPVTETTETEVTETETTTEETTTPEETTTVEAGFGKVTLVYVDDTGVEIHRRAENGLYRIGGEYATPTIYIDGYKFQSVDGPHSELQEPGMEGYIVFSVTGAENVYTFRYTRNSYAFNVSYTVGDNTVIENYSYPYTSTYQYTLAEKDGYVPVSYVISIGSDETEVEVDKVPYVIEGTMPYADVNISVKYATRVTFVCMDENKNVLKEESVIYTLGETYRYLVPQIDGYTHTEQFIYGTADKSKSVEISYKKVTQATTTIVSDYTPNFSTGTYPYLWIQSEYIDNNTGIKHVKIGIKKDANSSVEYISYWIDVHSGASTYGQNSQGITSGRIYLASGIDTKETTVKYYELLASVSIDNEDNNAFLQLGTIAWANGYLQTFDRCFLNTSLTGRLDIVKNLSKGPHSAKLRLKVRYYKNSTDLDKEIGTIYIDLPNWEHVDWKELIDIRDEYIAKYKT